MWKGGVPEVAAGFLADQYLVAAEGQGREARAVDDGDRAAAGAGGQGPAAWARVKVALEGKTLTELPVVALADVPVANFVGRAWDTIRLWFK